MFKHYLKISFRNLWKYKSQTLISVIGLAVGFACFAMATLWIRYEMTFDDFHKNSDCLYRVRIKDYMGEHPDGLTTRIEVPLDTYLKKTFPEIRNATKIFAVRPYSIKIDEVVSDVWMQMVWTDSSFLKIFDIRILEGNSDFLIPESKQIAITQETAAKLFGNENPIGKTIEAYGQYTIGAVISGFSKHTNYPFDILAIYDPLTFNSGEVIVELIPKVDTKSFTEKLYAHKATVEHRKYQNQASSMKEGWKGSGDIVSNQVDVEKIVLSPLTSIHYNDPYVYRAVKFQHVIIFAIAGSLLILCTLFNYLALFVSRFRIRSRELALRVVCGASNRSLFTLLSVEFIMSLVVALVFGTVLILIIVQSFRTLSGIDIELSYIYIESLIYIGAIVLISLLIFLLILYVFRRRSLNVTIRKGNSKMFRKTSIVVQLIISIGFAFCTTIILKQMYFLRTVDLGFKCDNRGRISTWIPGIDVSVLENQIKQIPEIEETVIGSSLLYSRMISSTTYDWDERPKDVEPIHMDMINGNKKYLKFYDIKIVAGEYLDETDGNEYVLINESAAKIFGWKDPVGKRFGHNNYYIVKGVLQNVFASSFTALPVPIIYQQTRNSKSGGISVLFKCREGTWDTCKEKIERIAKEKYPDANLLASKEAFNYEGRLYSENTLLKILTLISIVCLIVCVFGFVSMVSLTCEERRKEIAIRKINGATVKDILDIFFKEHLTLLGIGALIAFPAGYLIMKRWTEQYVLQTEISAWIYLSILLALIMTIVLCVGGKVYKTSRENPVNSIKS
jgi:hypothetical protein